MLLFIAFSAHFLPSRSSMKLFCLSLTETEVLLFPEENGVWRAKILRFFFLCFHHSNLDSKIPLFIILSPFLFVLFTLLCNSCAPSIASLIMWNSYKDLLFLPVAQEIKYSLHKLSLCHVNFFSLPLQLLSQTSSFLLLKGCTPNLTDKAILVLSHFLRLLFCILHIRERIPIVWNVGMVPWMLMRDIYDWKCLCIYKK